MNVLPTLSGRIVTLRPWRDEDASDLHREIQDPEIVRWLNVRLPYTVEDAAAFIRRASDEWELRQAVHFVIIDSSGRFQGYIAALALGEGMDEVEIVYWVCRDGRGQGLARDALETLVTWLGEVLKSSVIELGMVDGNYASARVAESCGFVLREVSKDSGSLDGQVADERIYIWPGDSRS